MSIWGWIFLPITIFMVIVAIIQINKFFMHQLKEVDSIVEDINRTDLKLKALRREMEEDGH